MHYQYGLDIQFSLKKIFFLQFSVTSFFSSILRIIESILILCLISTSQLPFIFFCSSFFPSLPHHFSSPFSFTPGIFYSLIPTYYPCSQGQQAFLENSCLIIFLPSFLISEFPNFLFFGLFILLEPILQYFVVKMAVGHMPLKDVLCLKTFLCQFHNVHFSVSCIL